MTERDNSYQTSTSKQRRRSYIHFNRNHSLRSSDLKIPIDFYILSLTVFSFFQGTCIDLVNNYTCNCFAGFTGSSCDVKIENCTDDSCYPNVTCFKNSEIISCGPCPLGFTGDGKNCKGINQFHHDKIIAFYRGMKEFTIIGPIFE